MQGAFLGYVGLSTSQPSKPDSSPKQWKKSKQKLDLVLRKRSRSVFFPANGLIPPNILLFLKG